MKEKRNQRKVKLGILLGLVICVILSWNTNRNPNALIEQILTPLHGEKWVFNYSWVILLMVMYQLLGQYGKVSENAWFHDKWKRIILIIIILYVSAPLNASVIKMYRGFYSGVEALCLEREDMRLRIENDRDQKETSLISGRLTLQNCSNEQETFWIEVSVPRSVQGMIVADHIVLKEPYTLEPREKRTIFFEQSLDQIRGWHTGHSSSSNFEVRVYDQKKSISFTRKFADEWLDDDSLYVMATRVLEVEEEVEAVAAVLHEPDEKQRERIDRYLTQNVYEAQSWDEQLLIIPYYAGSTVTLYEIGFAGDQFVEEEILGTYEIKSESEVVLLKVPVPCGIPMMKVVITYEGQKGEYVINYDGKGDRPQIETIKVKNEKH